jgi:hypothetical protein
MENAAGIPMWCMHPLVQYCLRMHQTFLPTSVETKDRDQSRWIKATVPSAQMLLERYRIKPGEFNLKFLDSRTNWRDWQKLRWMK